MIAQSIVRSFVALCLLVFSTDIATAQMRELKEGEPIFLEIVNNPLIADAEIGHVVEFKTTSNVLVDGKEVVRAPSGCDHAMPATGTRPAFGPAPARGVSMRHSVLIGPSADALRPLIRRSVKKRSTRRLCIRLSV